MNMTTFLKLSIIAICFLNPFTTSAQDDDEGEKKLCVEIDNKKALALYKKGTDKKKYKKP